MNNSYRSFFSQNVFCDAKCVSLLPHFFKYNFFYIIFAAVKQRERAHLSSKITTNVLTLRLFTLYLLRINFVDKESLDSEHCFLQISLHSFLQHLRIIIIIYYKPWEVIAIEIFNNPSLLSTCSVGTNLGCKYFYAITLSFLPGFSPNHPASNFWPNVSLIFL